MAPRVWIAAASTVAVLLIAGCVGSADTDTSATGAPLGLPRPGAGGAGGDATGTGGEAAPFYAQGGAGGDGTLGSDGRDGCPIDSSSERIVFCGVTLAVDGARFTVHAVVAPRDGGPGMSWPDVHLGVVASGYALRSQEVSVALDVATPIHGSFARQPPTPEDGTVHDATLDAVLDGPIMAGQAFEVCGVSAPGTARTWVRDARPIGAMFGIELQAAGCDGTPWQPPTVAVQHGYDLRVQGRAAMAVANASRNCLDFGGPAALEIAFTWTPSAPVSEQLVFRVAEAGGPWGDPVESTSPYRLVAATGEGGFLVGVFPMDAAITADQPVAALVQLRYPEDRAVPLPSGPASCPQP